MWLLMLVTTNYSKKYGMRFTIPNGAAAVPRLTERWKKNKHWLLGRREKMSRGLQPRPTFPYFVGGRRLAAAGFRLQRLYCGCAASSAWARPP